MVMFISRDVELSLMLVVFALFRLNFTSLRLALMLTFISNDVLVVAVSFGGVGWTKLMFPASPIFGSTMWSNSTAEFRTFRSKTS